MIKKILIIMALCISAAFAANMHNPINGVDLVTNMMNPGGYGRLFVYLQVHYFSTIFLAIIIGVPAIFLLHFLIIGPKVFSHDGKKIFIFSLFERIIHWIGGVSFTVLVPTGLVMVFAEVFGGGTFVTVCRELHAVATPFALVSLLAMLVLWFKDMLPIMADIKWMMIVGGYLSKKKRPIPASKYNAGQKMWFFTAIFGGLIMVFTGALMYFRDYDFAFMHDIMTQVEYLRLSVIVHNILGMVITAFFLIHVYMAAIAIKGAIHSMITGYKEEEEVKILHSIYYKKLKDENKI